jgi:CRP/FNR family transcriptional regulator, cyclic AMP receptor protein
MKKRHPLFLARRSIGQRSADWMTKWMGSWAFLILFGIISSLWVFANVYGFFNQWDPYPFILLNLFLSLLAAIQAPIILMSQNRESQKDRIRAEYDHQVNLASEKMLEQVQTQLHRIEKRLKK